MPIHSASHLTTLAQKAMVAAGALTETAIPAATVLIEADLQGLPTHGVSRVPFYCAMLRNGRIDGNAKPRVIRDSGATTLVDNADALPFEACRIAVDRAIVSAQNLGVGLAAVTRSGHTGALGINLGPVADAGMLALTCSNAPAAIPPWGGRNPLFGTNPIGAIFPIKGRDPIIVDLALTTVTRGRIMIAQQRGEQIPDTWGFDSGGNPTTDPSAVLKGGWLYPIGGAKGAMLALVVEVLCTALTGAAIGREVDSYFQQVGNKPRIGQIFLVINPAFLAGDAVYLERLGTIVEMMLAEDGVRLPGSRRHQSRVQLLRDGISVSDKLYTEITDLASTQK